MECKITKAELAEPVTLWELKPGEHFILCEAVTPGYNMDVYTMLDLSVDVRISDQYGNTEPYMKERWMVRHGDSMLICRVPGSVAGEWKVRRVMQIEPAVFQPEMKGRV